MSETFGSWALESVIAVGGLGEVWRATRDNDIVALKRLHTHLVRNPDARALFAIEQRLTTQLPRHPNVVHALEAGDVADRPYIALALAPGDDLRRQLAPVAPVAPGAPVAHHRGATVERGAHAAHETRAAHAAEHGHHAAHTAHTTHAVHAAHAAHVAMPRARAITLIAAAADGAAHLHAHGIAHGDINPGNLVIGGDDRVTLIDLGVARPIGEAGAVRGTHAYMAPEQVRGEAWTAATDVFALGVVLWELTAGARLFHRGPPWLSMAAVVEAPVPPLADPALDAIAQAALAKDPAHRLASAGELAARLRAISSHA